MNKTIKGTASKCIERMDYDSPALSVVELESEGVFCASGQFDPYEEDTLDW